MPTILLVDDSATDRSMIGGLLKKQGMQVRVAENGSGALKQIAAATPDVVVTDMQMPEMDGLELVKAVRQNHPHIPVILMTGHGSEELAARALQEGAASYVPKSKLKELLFECIDRVIDLKKDDSDFERLIDMALVTDFHFELNNDLTMIQPLVTLVQQMITGLGVCDPTSRIQVGIALEEALSNAILHGNLELSRGQLALPEEERNALIHEKTHSAPLKDRKCLVRCSITRDEARLTIRDEGPGFNVQNMLDISVNDESSRGLVLMWGLMDKVSFNKAGNEVVLIKRKHEHIQPATSGPTAETSRATATDVKPTREKLGELVSVDGGNSIVLSQKRISVGRHPSCDLVLAYPDVSQQHCLLYMYSGWWYVKDLKSANGIRINRLPVDQRRIAPGAILSIGTHRFEVLYNPSDLGAVGITPPVDPF